MTGCTTCPTEGLRPSISPQKTHKYKSDYGAHFYAFWWYILRKELGCVITVRTEGHPAASTTEQNTHLTPERIES